MSNKIKTMRQAIAALARQGKATDYLEAQVRRIQQQQVRQQQRNNKRQQYA